MKCLSVIDVFNLDDSPSTSYHEVCEELVESGILIDNLYEETDFLILFNTLFDMSEDPKNSKTLCSVLEIVRKSDLSVFQQQFEYFVLKILYEYKRRPGDYHVLLSALNIYETLNDPIFSINDISIVYITMVLRIFESRHEIFPCGCVQKMLISLYRQDNRFCKIINEMINGNMSLSKYQHLIDSSILSAASCFNLYTELLRELVQCKIIDKSGDELWNVRIVHLTFLLNTAIPDNDFPLACQFFSVLLNEIEPKNQRTLTTIMKKSLKQLINKIFDFVETSDGDYLLDDENLSMIASQISNSEKMSLEPLELLKTFQKMFQLNADMFQAIICQKLKLSAKTLKINMLYLITLSMKTEDSILEQILTFIKENFDAATMEIKDMFILFVKLLEIIGKTDKRVYEMCERQRFKQQLLLETPTSSIQTHYIVKSLEIFNHQEFDTFCQQHLKDSNSLTDSNWIVLISKVSEMNRYINSEVVWEYAMRRGDDEKCVQFIRNQLTILAESVEFSKRFRELLNVLKNDAKAVPPVRLLVGFLETILGFEIVSAPESWLILILPLAIVSYCLYYEDYEDKMDSIFRRLFEKITLNVSNEKSKMVFAKICESQPENVKIWTKLDEKWPKGETFSKVFTSVIDNSAGIMDKDKSMRAKKRVAEIISLMFNKAPNEIRSNGDRTSSQAFCKLSILFEKYNTQNSNFFDTICCREMIEGFAKCDTNGNIIFLKARIYSILLTAKKTGSHVLAEFGNVLATNKKLVEKLKTSKKDYAEIQEFVNW